MEKHNWNKLKRDGKLTNKLHLCNTSVKFRLSDVIIYLSRYKYI